MNFAHPTTDLPSGGPEVSARRTSRSRHGLPTEVAYRHVRACGTGTAIIGGIARGYSSGSAIPAPREASHAVGSTF